MIRHLRFGFDLGLILVVGASLALSSGCGSSSSSTVANPKSQAEFVQDRPLAEVGDLFRVITEDKGSPPASSAEVTKYEKIYPAACGKLKSGEIVVFFGVPLQDGASDQVLAYEKKAPESGGRVLMQDGKTIKEMTADEFKAAKKAG